MASTITPTGTSTATGLGYAGSFPTTAVRLQGTFVVDQNFTIASSEVRVDAGFEIVVLSGFTLTITSSTISNCDNATWNMIRINPGGDLVLENSSTVENAEIGVLAETSGIVAGSFAISASELINNKVGLEVGALAGAYPGTIISTEIHAPSPLSTATGDVVGIRVDDTDFTVGTTTSSFSTGTDHNDFHDLDIGIESTNTNLVVQDNLFTDMAIGGVFSTGSPNTSVVVGSPGTGVTGINNRFETSNGGVYCTGAELTVAGNEFEELNGGVWSQNAFATVEDNDMLLIRNFGVRVKNATGFSSVTDNVIDNSSNPSYGASSGTGIIMQNLPVSGEVINNQVYDLVNGIVADNMPAGLVEDNRITYIQPGGLQSRGIYARGSDEIEVYNNWINADYTGTSDDLKTIGIYLVTCPGFDLDRNISKNTGSGVRIDGNSFNCEITCNQIDTSVYGFVIAGVTDPSTQFGVINGNGTSATQASGNQWFPAATQNRTHCIASTNGDSIQWYYEFASFPLPQMDMPGSLNTFDVFPATDIDPILSTEPEYCDFPALRSSGGILTAQERDVIFSDLASALLDDGVVNCSNYGEKELFHDFFEADPTLLSLGDASDAAYTAMYDALSSAHFDELGSVWQILETDGLAAAQAWNNAIAAYCVEESDWQRVQEIHLDASVRGHLISDMLSGNLPYTPAEISDLQAIASKDDADANNAVMMARSMLEWEETESTSARVGASSSELNSFNEVLIYPNPVVEEFQVGFTGEIQKLQIYDLSGRILLTLPNPTQGQSIGIRNYHSGVYVLEIEDAQGISSHHRIIKR